MTTRFRQSTTQTVARVVSVLVLGVLLPVTACGRGGQPTDQGEPTGTSASEVSETADAATPDPTGRWSSPEAGEPFLEFSAEGGLDGSDGCNAIASTWEIDGETVRITPFVSTQKACPGVNTWLSKAVTATIDGDVMTVEDQQGSVIGGLEKEE